MFNPVSDTLNNSYHCFITDNIEINVNNIYLIVQDFKTLIRIGTSIYI